MSGKHVWAVLCVVSLLALILFVGCSRDTDPTEAVAHGTLAVEPAPESAHTPWRITGPDGFSLEGDAARELTDLSPGEYELTWQASEGLVRPWPTRVAVSVDAGAETVVRGEFRENVPSVVSVVASPGDLQAGWTLRGSEGLIESGVGDRVFENVDAGHYELTWELPEGWLNTSPVKAEGETYGAVLALGGVFAPDVETPEGYQYAPAGVFTMGSPVGEWGRENDETAHEVTLTNDFMISESEVTLREFRDAIQWALENDYVVADTTLVETVGIVDSSVVVMDNLDGSSVVLLQMGMSNLQFNPTALRFRDPSYTDANPNEPIVGINWYGAAAYCDWLTLMDDPEADRAYDHSDWSCNGGQAYAATGFRLPTEAEWEYAARAGSETAFASGPVVNPVCADPNLELIGWHCMQNYQNVDGKEPNSWGLYDASGNAWEWVQDWYDGYSADPVTDPVVVSSGNVEESLARIAETASWLPEAEGSLDGGAEKAAEPVRVVRGGGAKDYAVLLRSANRSGYDPYWAHGMLGFRVVRTLSGVVE